MFIHNVLFQSNSSQSKTEKFEKPQIDEWKTDLLQISCQKSDSYWFACTRIVYACTCVRMCENENYSIYSFIYLFGFTFCVCVCVYRVYGTLFVIAVPTLRFYFYFSICVVVFCSSFFHRIRADAQVLVCVCFCSVLFIENYYYFHFSFFLRSKPFFLIISHTQQTLAHLSIE